MESLCQASKSLISLESEHSNVPSKKTTNGDQRFLLLFIMGTYFGPDLKGEEPQKSILQRMAVGLPPYTSDQLAGSQMKTVVAERIYYYVLRKADQSVLVKLPLLRQFFRGDLFIPSGDPDADYRQFPDLFPLHLHAQSRHKNIYKIIENIVFINNPEISYIKPEDVEKFKRLTGLEDLLLDRGAASSFAGVGIRGLTDATSALQESNKELSLRRSPRNSGKRQRANDQPESEESLIPFNSVPDSSTPVPFICEASFPAEVNVGPVERLGPVMLFLPSSPTTEEWNNITSATKNGIALSGSAAQRPPGPLVGQMDFGECKDAYLFRISLPGVRKDERSFSCEVDSDGQVLIKGVTTTGEEVVHMCSQAFEMQTQNFCKPGPFSVSFKLPGPVEPQEFSGIFGVDGVLEGVVPKEKSRKP